MVSELSDLVARVNSMWRNRRSDDEIEALEFEDEIEAYDLEGGDHAQA